LNKKAIHTDSAPAAVGSYSQAIQSGNFVFLSGQIPLDPSTMEIVAGDFEARARCVFDNLKAVAGVRSLPKGVDVEAEAILAL
jgi:enamine deaminase RidA (YjgF/YER057c/UK114 family)